MMDNEVFQIMANPKHVEVVRAGAEAIREYDKKHRQLDSSNDYLDLSGANLEGVDLNSSDLSQIDFSDCNLKGAQFCNTRFHSCIFERTVLENASFINAQFLEGTFQDCVFNLMEACILNFDSIRFVKCDFSGLFLDAANFRQCEIIDTNLTETHLIDSAFICSKIHQSNMTGIMLFNSVFENTELKDIQCDYFFFSNAKPTRQIEEAVDSIPHAVSEEEYFKHYIRIPQSGSLKSGEFEDRFRARPTVEFLFTEGMSAFDPALLGIAIDAANQKDPDAGLRILDLTSRGGLPRAIIEIADKLSKKDGLALVDGCYQQALEQLQTEIQSHKQEKASLLEVISQKMLIPAMEAKTRNKRGRKKDPKIKTRNKEIARYKAHNSKKTYAQVGKHFDVSAEVARKACSNPDN